MVLVDIKIDDPRIIFIKDTRKFIKKFCNFIIQSYKGKIIAITGSVGKTTYKENLYHILKSNNLKTYRSFKNYNNIQGLQFSIMNMKINSDYSVYELGINNPNEMSELVKILQPHYCLITCIENSHIGKFKNFKHLMNNKLKIFNSKRLINGLVNYNYDADDVRSQIHSKVKLLNVEFLKKNSLKIKKNYIIKFFYNNKKYKIVSHRGNYYENIAIISFLFLKKIIKKFRSNIFFYEQSIIESRGREVSTFICKKKVKFFDHSYNASPYSLKKQIILFNERNIIQKVYILGSMKELGNQSEFHHLQIIEFAIKLNLKKIIFIGEEFYKLKFRFKNFIFYKNYNSAVKLLNKEIDNIKNIFIMGSRHNQLERIINNYVR